MSFFFSLKNKSGFIAFIFLALSFVTSYGHANSAKQEIPQVSDQDLLLLNIIVMVEGSLPQNKDDTPKGFAKIKEKEDIPLSISRRKIKEAKKLEEEKIKKLLSSSDRELPE